MKVTAEHEVWTAYGVLPLCVSLFPAGPPLRPKPAQMGVSKMSAKVECVQMFECKPNIFVVVCKSVWVKISFLSLHNLYKWICWKASSICLAALSACFVLSHSPPCSFLISLWRHSVDIVSYCLFVETMCIHSERHTFPVNIRDWIHSKKITASPARFAEQTIALSKYQPAPTLSLPDPKVNVGQRA